MKLSHLDEGQRAELVEVLDEFAACFSDKPGLCDVVAHRIMTTPDFVPKQMRPYRVPIAFRADVNRQIRELLDMGLIRPSVSPMASPIVCVAKKSGGVRIACDYRYLVHSGRCVPHVDDQRDVDQDRIVEDHLHVRPQERLLADTRGGGRPVADSVRHARRTIRMGPHAVRTQERRRHIC